MTKKKIHRKCVVNIAFIQPIQHGLVSGPGKHRVKTGCTQGVAHQARKFPRIFSENSREAAPLCPKVVLQRTSQHSVSLQFLPAGL